MLKRVVFTIVALAIVFLAPDARAQGEQTGDRVYVSVNGGYQGTSTKFTNTVLFVENLESGSFEANYAVKSGPEFDVGFGVRLVGPLGVGLAVSRFTSTDTATVTAEIPHPFFFNMPRSVSGEGGGIRREETGVHVQALFIIPAAKRLKVTLFGGPSFFRVRQSLVSNVTYSETYPYDTATFEGVETTEKSSGAKKVGLNAGVDGTVLLWSNVGVGGQVRFSRASIDLTSPDGKTLAVDVGGVQVGAGLRLRF